MSTVSEAATVLGGARLAMLTAHLFPSCYTQHINRLHPHHLLAQSQPANVSGTLIIKDTRTGNKYQVQISPEGTVKATDLKKISTGENDKGLKLYDPGYLNTAPVRSKISYIDRNEGILRYRGYPIHELVNECNFMEVSYLILYGNLPSESQLEEWQLAISQHSAVPQGVLDIIQSMPHDAHPMGVLVNAISALSVYHPDANPALKGHDIYKSKPVRDKQIARVIGKITTIAAAIYLTLSGRQPVLPSKSRYYTENFLYMLDSLDDRSYRPHEKLTIALDQMFILNAEHEMNCSTAAVRHLASSGVDVYTAIAAGVGAVSEPLHGAGASEAVLKMLSEIGNVENITEFIEGVKASNRKLYGFEHQVNNDPREMVLHSLAKQVVGTVEPDPIIEVALALETAVLSDEYFINKNLYPNTDFYSGLIYWAMGFPPEFFSVLVAIPRMAGYLAHWKESLDDPDTKIMRPQQVYVGEWLRYHRPINERAVSMADDQFGQVAMSNATKRRLAGSRM